MSEKQFRALVLIQDGKEVRHEIRSLPSSDLPPGDTTVAVSHSTLNYKDGMILRGLGRLVRSYPHVPGVDFAGLVGYGGSVAACGLAGGSELSTTVIPFLLRSVSLLGIDSVMQPLAARESAWRRIAATLPGDVLDQMTRTVRLDDVPGLADEILQGRVRGRIVVEIGGARA